MIFLLWILFIFLFQYSIYAQESCSHSVTVERVSEIHFEVQPTQTTVFTKDSIQTLELMLEGNTVIQKVTIVDDVQNNKPSEIEIHFCQDYYSNISGSAVHQELLLVPPKKQTHFSLPLKIFSQTTNIIMTLTDI